jgi:hypothetical protein
MHLSTLINTIPKPHPTNIKNKDPNIPTTTKARRKKKKERKAKKKIVNFNTCSNLVQTLTSTNAQHPTILVEHQKKYEPDQSLRNCLGTLNGGMLRRLRRKGIPNYFIRSRGATNFSSSWVGRTTSCTTSIGSQFEHWIC